MKKIVTLIFAYLLMGLNLYAQKEKEITIQTDSFKLPGTLMLPNEGDHFPIAILVHGSGPSNRDEKVGPNRTFYEIAEGLAKHGIASIRYDKRTFVYREKYANKGNETPETETILDALSAIKLASTLENINKKRIFIIGHSLGATLAPEIARRSEITAGFISLSGYSRDLIDLALEQTNYLSQNKFIPKAYREQAKIQKSNMIMSAINTKNLGTNKYKPYIPLLFNLPKEYWMYMKEYNQTETAKKLSIPMLFMQGERDYQVTMKDFKLWKEKLKGNKKAFFASYPNLNHLYQAGSGFSNPKEYFEPNPFDSIALQDIIYFIKNQKLQRKSTKKGSNTEQ